MSNISAVNSHSQSRRVYFNDFTGLGSTCLAIPVLRAMENASPHIFYSYPSNPLSRDAELASHLNLQHIVGWHREEWRRFDERDWTTIAQYLQLHRFDTFINFRNPDLIADPRYSHFKQWCSQKRFELQWYDYYEYPTNSLVNRHIQERMVNLLSTMGIATQPLHQDWLADSLPSMEVLPSLRLGIFLGASTLVKRWPMDNWYQLTTKVLTSTHFDLELISGSSKEEQEYTVELYEHLRELTTDTRVFLLQYGSLSVLVSSLRQLTALITNDTGVTHLANACRVPTLALFLATESLVWGPQSKWSLTLQSMIGRKCPLQRPLQGNCERHYDRCDAPCHEGILSEDVLQALYQQHENIIMRNS
jgi:ADP-heptose:LPS heptosyltransferase